MATIDEIIQQELNPFDPVTFKTGNFWREQDQATAPTVESIHQEAISQVTQVLNLVAQDNHTRTLLLSGDQGSGKSYLLSRLKSNFNHQAFFAYIDPCPSNDYIWRHTLRYTIDSLMHLPIGQKDSQLLLWLKGLSIFQNQNVIKNILGKRGLFVLNFRSTYPVGIYQAKEFFRVLYGLTQEDLYPTACDWLRGENLDEEDLKALGVNSAIDSEETARGILSNLGMISASTQPIVLCFDQVELAPQLPDGSRDLKPLFSINTTFHNEKLQNFLIIISITTNEWKANQQTIPQSDLARIEQNVALKAINFDQAKALWQSRLHPLHCKAEPAPFSPIYPLTEEALEQSFPGGKTYPRQTLALASKLFLQHKLGSEPEQELAPEKPDLLANFKLLWLKEFKQTQKKVTRLRQFSSRELITMLRKALYILAVKELEIKFLPSPKYAHYSFSYQRIGRRGTIGVVWTEEPNLNSFCYVMKACDKAIAQKMCQRLYLIRGEGIGKPRQKGNKIYQQIFVRGRHQHLNPDLASLQILATYNRLVNSLLAGELVIVDQSLGWDEFQDLVRESQVLDDCYLLQALLENNKKPEVKTTIEQAQDFLIDVVKTQRLMGRKTLVNNVLGQFPQIEGTEIEQLIEQLCEDKQISILDREVAPQAQVIVLSKDN